MNTSPTEDFGPLENSLLWDAVEGIYLIEIRNSAKESGLSIDAYRRKAGAAIERLLDLGLIQVSVGAWGTPDLPFGTRSHAVSPTPPPGIRTKPIC